MSTGNLYLIPVPIAEGIFETIPEEVRQHTLLIKHFFAEDVRTARRTLKALHPALIIDELHFSEIDKHHGADMKLLKSWLLTGYDVGIVSEAGCPGIADPGAELVAVAQAIDVTVIPLTGPNSVILALMASGLNGQSFSFVGYLPVKEPARSKRIHALEELSAKEKQTQIFIETPYRNDVLLADLLKNCNKNTKLTIAQNITSSNAFIKTRTIADWNKNKPELGKSPAVFLILT
jgi:16S rRNA (cytidine1402-2'-O)-methyltransferase